MKIVILIVNYNSWDVVRSMLVSSNSLDILPEFYILDNNSNDPPGFDIESVSSNAQITLVNFEYNYGYFGAAAEFLLRNPGIEFDWLFVANADLVFSDPCLFNYLEDFTRPYQSVGVYCPSIISEVTGQDQNPFLSSKPSLYYYYKYKIIYSHFIISKAYALLFSLKSKVRRILLNTQTKKNVKSVFAPHGAFLGFSKHYFSNGGIIENRNFLFFEEEIVGFICEKIGLRVIYDPRVRIDHQEHIVTGSSLTIGKILIKKHSLSIVKEYFFPKIDCEQTAGFKKWF